MIYPVNRCIYERCPEPVDGWFLLAEGGDDVKRWPLSIPYLEEPLPLCHWHALLVGGQRVPSVVGGRASSAS